MIKIKNKNLRKGFTILELLVVIAIAAMILSFAMVNIRETRKRSRDARREEDIKQIQNALAIYATNQGIYPICATEVVIGAAGDSCIGPILISAGSFGSGQTPRDPLSGVSGTCGTVDSYGYCYRSVNGSTYEIRYGLETNAMLGKSAGWQPIFSP